MFLCIARKSPLRPTWGMRHSVELRTLPQDTSLRERVEKSYWTSLAWSRLHMYINVDNNNVLFLEAS
jgi:hypothetical protein